MTKLHPNAALIGVANGRSLLDTPALIVDHAALTRNIARMASFTKTRGVALRPHIKTHKNVQIARLQVAAGAIGVSCVTMGEAEVMVDAGIPGVLITSPAITPSKIARLIALAHKTKPGDVMIVVDNPANVQALADAAAVLDRPLDVLVDYGAGYNRTGTLTEADALALITLVQAQPTLTLRGVQAYAGNMQHIQSLDRRTEVAAQLRKTVASIVAAARAQGAQIDIVTGAGTGTHALDSTGEVFTEMQAGSYVFMDAEYSEVLADASGTVPFEVSLFVQAAVVSTNAPDWVTLDAGTKCLATDSGVTLVASGVDKAIRYGFFGDEHGKLLVEAGNVARPALGTKVELVTPHCDPTVNLHDFYHVVDGDTLVALWPIEARGKR